MVKFEAIHSLRKMTLNRPSALNALNSEMVALIQPQLEVRTAVPAAVLTGAEMGDLSARECDPLQGQRQELLRRGRRRQYVWPELEASLTPAALVKQLDDPATWAKSSEFFQQEYATDAYIAKMKKPIVTIMHGNTLGGGVGLSVHAPFRIATETTKIAMPEVRLASRPGATADPEQTAIGLFPDVGATFFLSRLDGQLGLYLGLTGDRVTGAGAFLSGLATHFVPSERLLALESRLAELSQSATHDDVNAAIEEFAADPSELKTNYRLVGATRQAIDLIFARATAEDIVADLQALEAGTYAKMAQLAIPGKTTDVAALQAWAKETRAKLESMSPTSVKVALRSIREGKSLDIDEAFMLDMRIATACCVSPPPCPGASLTCAEPRDPPRLQDRRHCAAHRQAEDARGVVAVDAQGGQDLRDPGQLLLLPVAIQQPPASRPRAPSPRAGVQGVSACQVRPAV